MPEKKGTPLKPTVVQPPDPKKKAAKTVADGERALASAPMASGTLKPTMIAGVERKRVEVDARDLRKLAPGTDANVIEAALRLLAGFVVEKASERRAILWGHELQQSYSDLVAETLVLSQSPILRKVEGYLGRMMDILQAVDILAVCGHGPGGLAGYFKGVNSKIDQPDELGAARTELDQLVKYMSAALEELLDLKDQLDRHMARLEEIAEGAEAGSLAALFLAQYLQKDRAAVAERFTERSMSLTQTLAQIRESGTIREIQIEHPLRMVGAIQTVVLVAMPDFLSSIATVVSLAAQKASLSRTEAGELNYKLRDIINRLAT